MGTLPFGLSGPAQPGVDYSAIPVPADASGTVVAGADSSGTDTSGWLSGLGDLFMGVGSAVSSGLRAANTPNLVGSGSGWVYNPATGQYYNPATGQALTSTGTLTSAAGFTGALTGQSGFLWIAIIGLIAFLLLRKS